MPGKRPTGAEVITCNKKKKEPSKTGRKEVRR